MIKMSYADLSNFNFAQTMQKIAQAPMHGAKASQVHKVMKALGVVREQISSEYQKDIVGTYGKKDEKGEIVRPQGEPNGFEPVEDQQAAFLSAQEAFGKKIAELNIKPIGADILADLKVSAMDLEALKGMYDGNSEFEKPAHPEGLRSV